MALALAAQKAGTTEPNKVRDALAALDTDSFFGRVRFDSNGQNTYKPMAVIQIHNGLPTSVWPKDSAEAPMVWPGTGS